MSDESNGAPPPDRATPARLPYEKPALSWEDDLATRPGLIAACNKAVPLTACDTGSLQS